MQKVISILLPIFAMIITTCAKDHNGSIYEIKYTNKNNYLMSSSDNGMIKIWDSNVNLINTIYAHKDTIEMMAISPNDEYIVSGSYDNTIKIWKFNGNLINTIKGYKDFTEISFSPDSNSIIYVSNDNCIKTYNIMSNTIKTILKVKWNICSFGTIAFSDDWKYLILGCGSYQKVKIYNFQGILIKEIKGVISPDYITFSKNGELFYFTYGSEIVITNTNGHIIKKIFTQHKKRINKISFDPRSQIILTASDDKTINLWDSNWNLLKTLKEHYFEVKAIDFDKDGSFFASGSWDETIIIWNRNGRVYKRIGSPNIFKILFAPLFRTLMEK